MRETRGVLTEFPGTHGQLGYVAVAADVEEIDNAQGEGLADAGQVGVDSRGAGEDGQLGEEGLTSQVVVAALAVEGLDAAVYGFLDFGFRQ